MKWGSQDPPNDPRIYNRRQPNGIFRPLTDFWERGKTETQINLRCSLCDKVFEDTTPEAELEEYVLEDDGTYSGEDVFCPQCDFEDQLNITRDWCR